MSDSKKEVNHSFFFGTAIGALLFVVIIRLFWKSAIPFTFFEFWRLNYSWIDVFKTVWPMFVWGGATTMFFCCLREKELDESPGEIFVDGTIISLWAGISEEITYRWLIFYAEIIGYKILNFLFCGLISWIFLYITGPIANFFTIHYLEPYLFNSLEWAVGSAMISSNGKFRDGHVYLGIIGYVNSWFLGMYFFYIMFEYGLPAAIVTHFLYDFIIFTTSAIIAKIKS